ncbi:MAG: TAXI family TRAP transporter solute-binding subunit [Propionibacteriaceae bacterium]
MLGSAISRRRALLGAGGLGLAVGLGGCGTDAGEAVGSLRIACGEPGGTYIQFGQLLADALIGADIAVAAEALTTDGSVENLRLLESGEAHLGMCLADSAALSEWTPYAIGRVYQNYLQCFVPADSPIRTHADLVGTRISIGAPGSGTAGTSTRVLAALQLTGEGAATELVNLNLAVAADQLAGREIDVLIWSGGIPAPEIVGLQEQIDVRLIDLTDAISLVNAQQAGVFQHTIIPAEVYDQPADVGTLGVSNFLLCRPDLPDEAAADLVDLLIDNARALVPEPSAGVQYLTPSSLIDTSPIELHPAAARRYVQRHD